MANTKQFGRLSARPSEYLIKLRRGRVVAHGPGLSVRIWPGDSVTVLPTSIQRTSFVADQVTSEKVGVAVTGVAVFRVADPLLAFRMLDFEESRRGIEQLAQILKEMFIGAARRLVANMTVEECLTRRKESIALELMREIQPVVAGQGHPDDDTRSGWGVVLDTIEIQDVRILSEKVFSDLQTPYRARLEQQARSSQVQRDQEVHLKQISAKEKMLEVDQQLGAQEAEAEERKQMRQLERDQRLQAAGAQKEEQVAQLALAAQVKDRQRRRTLEQAEHHASLELIAEQKERAQEEHGATLRQLEEQGEQAQRELALKAELERARVTGALERQQLEHELARQQLLTERARDEHRLWLQQAQREVENSFSPDRLRYELIETLPAVAEALSGALGKVNLTLLGGSGAGFGATMTQIASGLRAAGVELSGLLGPREEKSDPGA